MCVAEKWYIFIIQGGGASCRSHVLCQSPTLQGGFSGLREQCHHAPGWARHILTTQRSDVTKIEWPEAKVGMETTL
jgi:hypothetical protein